MIHLLIHIGFPHWCLQQLEQGGKKEKYRKYYPYGRVDCSDQLPIIWFWWKWLLKRDSCKNTENHSYLVAFQKQLEWYCGFLNGQACGGSGHSCLLQHFSDTTSFLRVCERFLNPNPLQDYMSIPILRLSCLGWHEQVTVFYDIEPYNLQGSL